MSQEKLTKKDLELLNPKITTETMTLKIIEELFEVGEVLTKSLTKSEEDKPPMSKLIEEIGDLEFRLMLLKSKLNIEKDIKKRISDKYKMLKDYLNNNESFIVKIEHPNIEKTTQIQIFNHLKKIVDNRFGLKVVITSQNLMEEGLGDLDLVELIMDLELEYNISFSDEFYNNFEVNKGNIEMLLKEIDRLIYK